MKAGTIFRSIKVSTNCVKKNIDIGKLEVGFEKMGTISRLAHNTYTTTIIVSFHEQIEVVGLRFDTSYFYHSPLGTI